MSTNVSTPETTVPAGFTPEISEPGSIDFWHGPKFDHHGVGVCAYWQPETGMSYDVFRIGTEAPLDLAQIKELHASLGALIKSTEGGSSDQG